MLAFPFMAEFCVPAFCSVAFAIITVTFGVILYRRGAASMKHDQVTELPVDEPGEKR